MTIEVDRESGSTSIDHALGLCQPLIARKVKLVRDLRLGEDAIVFSCSRNHIDYGECPAAADDLAFRNEIGLGCA